MGGFLSKTEKPEKRITIVGCKGSGKSHFIEVFEQTLCDNPPTRWIKEFSLEYEQAILKFTEFGGAFMKNPSVFQHPKYKNNCLYFFINGTENDNYLYKAKQLFLLNLIELKVSAPICIILNLNPQLESTFTFKDIDRVFQLHSLARARTIMMIKLTFEISTPIKYLLNWTIESVPSKN